MTGEVAQVCVGGGASSHQVAISSEDILKAFDGKLLKHLTSASQLWSSGSDSDGEGSSGPPGKSEELNIAERGTDELYFKGFPECDYLR